MKKLKENLKVLEDKEFKARITEEKDVTFDLFKDLFNLAFKEQRSDSRIQNVNIFWIKDNFTIHVRCFFMCDHV